MVQSWYRFVRVERTKGPGTAEKSGPPSSRLLWYSRPPIRHNLPLSILPYTAYGYCSHGPSGTGFCPSTIEQFGLLTLSLRLTLYLPTSIPFPRMLAIVPLLFRTYFDITAYYGLSIAASHWRVSCPFLSSGPWSPYCPSTVPVSLLTLLGSSDVAVYLAIWSTHQPPDMCLVCGCILEHHL